MKHLILTVGLLNLISNSIYSQGTLHQLALEEIERLREEMVAISDEIWDYSELSYEEVRSSALIKQTLENHGFATIETAGGITTQFVATYGKEGPVIGLFGEYDADESASNESIPLRKPRSSTNSGHGGHHNLLGVGSLAAALALKKLISEGKLKCRVKYFGTTDEGGIGGKVGLARQGQFDNLDFSIYWHPSPVTRPSTHIWDSIFEFELDITANTPGRIHLEPQNSSPLYYFNHLMTKFDSLKKMINPEIRINYHLKSNSNNLQVYPDSLQVRMIFQHTDQKENAIFYEQSKRLMKSNDFFGIDFRLIRAKHEFIVNRAALKLIEKNMQVLGEIEYSEQEIAFVDQFFEYLDKNGTLRGRPGKLTPETPKKLFGYASDIGEASWFAPEAYFVTTTLPAGASMHHWHGTIFSKHSIGHKGMIYAAKVMTMTIIDYVQDRSIQKRIEEEFQSKTKGYVYRSYK